MARERHLEELLAEHRKFQQLADKYLELYRLASGQEREHVVVDGKQIRKSVNWRPADSVAILLEFGKRFVPAPELLKELVDGNHVNGATEEKKYESAKVVLTMGLAKGYLYDTPEGVGYRTGKRKSKVLKNA